ncbi:techylectin-like protein isoform X1 [Argiope bruennichi]|uniref:techylectin-like protein isoform X1 n=1 Tax=Argiope bruennichi TaxID=94029 RepID=UPI00249584DA|nr:techylectin-like protein isoform X1 [Argiope bruennichi]
MGLLFYISICLVTSQSFGNGNANCDLSDKSRSYLDGALDLMKKAKENLPECSCNQICRPIDCEEVLINGRNESGVYTIWPRGRIADDKPMEVYCDMDTDGGGWTVIQRRGNYGRPSDYFYKDWMNYKKGFGSLEKDFWLGNDNIFTLTNQRLYSIRFDLKAVDGERRHALYDKFWIDDEDHKYTLHIKDYSGDAGDSMTPNHDNQKFSTKDQNNGNNKGGNCAESHKGAWWYNACHTANLNGLYLRGKHNSYADGVNWYTFRNYHESLEDVEMKIRAKNFKKNYSSMNNSRCCC